MRVLAIIPARGGSKGVPGKNIKLLGGKPLIAHAIDCAKACQKVSRIIVSTDSEEIASTSISFGAEVIMRPAELAHDTANVVGAVAHVLAEVNEDFDIVVLLQPTSPLRTARELEEIITIFEEEQEVENVISVVPFDDFHPARMYTLTEDFSMLPFMNQGETFRRQDLAPVYYRNGCFYAIRTAAFLRAKTLMLPQKRAYVMDANWLANIDSIRDFKIAALLYTDWKNENSRY